MRKRRRRNSTSTDRISELPDDVIGIIISQLKTEAAVRTSVLSTRWKHLWKLTTSTCFNFDAEETVLSIKGHRKEERKELIERERRKFIRWVEQVVDNHEGSRLDELVVDCDLDARHSPYLDKWISFAVSKNAKTINIKLLQCFYYEGNERYAFIKSAPALSGIECLTSLCLKYVEVTATLIEQFLSACPLLERLSLRNPKKLRNLRVIGASLNLKYLEIEHCSKLKSIEISAPNLLSFRFESYYIPQILVRVENLPSLFDLHIPYAKNNYVLPQFSSCFTQLLTLTLCGPVNKIILLNLLEHSQFTSLKHLTFIESSLERDCMQCLPEFISLCPVLHKFTLKLNILKNTKPEEIKWRMRRLNSLKEVELIGNLNSDSEIKIVMFLLRNATRLKKFIIHHFWGTSWTKEELLRRAKLRKIKVSQGVELLIKPYFCCKGKDL